MMILYTVVVVLFLFGITIFVHELGHYLVARWCGMVVETFSIGFGPPLWQRKIDGITYKIGCLPFGGYVALPQMDPTGESSQVAVKEGEPPAPPLPPAAAWKRILVAAAGATGNMLLAVLLAYVVFWAGKPSSPHERTCTVGFVETNCAAYAQGLRVGDDIVEADGHKIGNWMDLMTQVTLASREKVPVTVRRPDGTTNTLELTTEKIPPFGVRMPAGVDMVNLCLVLSTRPGSSAEAAGLRKDDLILALAGEQIYGIGHLVHLVDRHRDQDVPILIRRDGREVTLLVRPKYDAVEKRALIGIQFNQTGAVDYDKVVHPKPWDQIRTHAGGIFRFLKALVTPKEAAAAAGAVGGPVSILALYWQIVQKSFIMAVWFTGFLNVNLAILNLLPIPVLDGGHIMFSAWEWITRRPVGPRVLGWIHRVFAFLLIGLFLLLTYRDIAVRIWPGARTPRSAVAAVPTNAPPATPTNAAPAPGP